MSDGVREVRGWVHALSWEDSLSSDMPKTFQVSTYEREHFIEVRVIARLPGEPDGLPVGSDSNHGPINSPPRKGPKDPHWFQSTIMEGHSGTRALPDLKPASPPETYAVVYDGLTAETAEFLAKIQGGRVVPSSELKGGS